VREAGNRDDAVAVMNAALDRCAGLVQGAMDRGPRDLILFPEFVLTGGPGEDVVPDIFIAKACIDMDGPQITRMQEIAQHHRVFLAANVYSRSAMFPGRYFNTSFLIDRSGELVLTYYRLNTSHSNSPHDFLVEFVDRLGFEALYPVARTELGNIAMLPSMELMFPELPRMFVFRGAEILLHTTGENIVDQSVKRARAAENMMFVLSANLTERKGNNPEMEVGSRIIDWRGSVLAHLNEGVEGFCSASIDIEGLRRRRADPAGPNYLVRGRMELFKDIYAGLSLYPANSYEDGINFRKQLSPNFDVSLAEMAARGMIDPQFAKKF
jgi:predicted amidohydrolase